MTISFTSTAILGRDGLALSVARIAGEYILRIERDGAKREERYASREQAWERIDALDGRKVSL